MNFDPQDVQALSDSARDHLWMHFTRMSGATPGHEIPVITHGEGVWVYDQHGKRYLDGLSGLFARDFCIRPAPPSSLKFR